MPLGYYEKHQIGDFSAETVKGSHKTTIDGERSINYLLTSRGGTTLLYALDTGYYDDETWEYLSGKHTDALIMDCTFGGRADRGEYPFGHLDNASFIRMLEKMDAIGFINDTTRVFATHFNPHQGLAHHEIQQFFDACPYNVSAAYDGLTAEL